MAQILPLSIKTLLLLEIFLFKKHGKDPVSGTFRYNWDTTQSYNKREFCRTNVKTQNPRCVYEMRCSLPVYQVTKYTLLQSAKPTLINIHVLMVFEWQLSSLAPPAKPYLLTHSDKESEYNYPSIS